MAKKHSRTLVIPHATPVTEKLKGGQEVTYWMAAIPVWFLTENAEALTYESGSIGEEIMMKYNRDEIRSQIGSLLSHDREAGLFPGGPIKINIRNSEAIKVETLRNGGARLTLKMGKDISRKLIYIDGQHRGRMAGIRSEEHEAGDDRLIPVLIFNLDPMNEMIRFMDANTKAKTVARDNSDVIASNLYLHYPQMLIDGMIPGYTQEECLEMYTIGEASAMWLQISKDSNCTLGRIIKEPNTGKGSLKLHSAVRAIMEDAKLYTLPAYRDADIRDRSNLMISLFDAMDDVWPEVQKSKSPNYALFQGQVSIFFVNFLKDIMVALGAENRNVIHLRRDFIASILSDVAPKLDMSGWRDDQGMHAEDGHVWSANRVEFWDRKRNTMLSSKGNTKTTKLLRDSFRIALTGSTDVVAFNAYVRDKFLAYNAAVTESVTKPQADGEISA